MRERGGEREEFFFFPAPRAVSFPPFCPRLFTTLLLPLSPLLSPFLLLPPVGKKKKTRSPGTIFGRVVRTARFSPSSLSGHPGQLRSLRLRTQTPEGLAAAISRAEALVARGRGDGSGNAYFTASGLGGGSGGDTGDGQLSDGGGGPTLEDEQVAAMA